MEREMARLQASVTVLEVLPRSHVDAIPNPCQTLFTRPNADVRCRIAFDALLSVGAIWESCDEDDRPPFYIVTGARYCLSAVGGVLLQSLRNRLERVRQDYAKYTAKTTV
jgi:hypothetical protein